MVMIPVTFLNEFRCITDEMKQKNDNPGSRNMLEQYEVY